MNSKQRRTQRRSKPIKTEGRYEPTPMPTPEDMFKSHEAFKDYGTYRGYPWKNDFWGGFIIGGLAFMAVTMGWWLLVMGPLVRDLEQKQAFNELALVEAADAVRDALLMCP